MGNTKNIEPEDDRDILTIDLNAEELMVALDLRLTKKQKNLRIHKMRRARKRMAGRIPDMKADERDTCRALPGRVK